MNWKEVWLSFRLSHLLFVWLQVNELLWALVSSAVNQETVRMLLKHTLKSLESKHEWSIQVKSVILVHSRMTVPFIGVVAAELKINELINEIFRLTGSREVNVEW